MKLMWAPIAEGDFVPEPALPAIRRAVNRYQAAVERLVAALEVIGLATLEQLIRWRSRPRIHRQVHPGLQADLGRPPEHWPMTAHGSLAAPERSPCTA